MKYQAHFLGIPELYTDGKRCVFPFRKAQALAFMLIEEKSVSKSSICEFLWADKATEKARRNLSNALSCVKKILPLKADGGDVISLDPNIKIERDTDLILKLDTLGWRQIAALCRPYIDVSEMSDWPYFSDWLLSKRQHYGALLVRNLKKRAQERLAGYAKNGTEDALLCYEKLAELEPYDEKIHAELVRLYIKTNQKVKAIDAAHAFSSRMEKDFGIEADLSEISSLIKRKKEVPRIRASAASCDANPLARKNEIAKMLDFFRGGKESQSLCGLVWGEQGIGKTVFISEIVSCLKKSGWHCFSIECLQEEKSYPLASVTRLLKQLRISGERKEDIKFLSEYSYSYTADLLHRCIAGTDGDRRLLVIENIQWMDDASWNVIESVMGDNSAPRNMLVSGFEEIRPAFMLRTALADEPFEKFEVTLARFNLEETARICSEMAPDEEWSDERVHEIYMQTEGNPFFIKEMLRHRQGGITGESRSHKNVYLSVIEHVAENERLFLEAAAVCPESASMLETAAVLGITPLEVSGYYNGLRLHGLLRERANAGDVFYYFTHAKIREALLSEMSLSRKTALHIKNIELLEASLPETLRYRHRGVCLRLAFHCREAGLPLKELYWRVRDLELHFTAVHEVFPTLVDQDLMHYIPTVEDVSYTQKAIGEAWKIMDTLFRSEGGSPGLLRLERDLYILKGAYLWWSGCYSDAEVMLRGAMRKALAAGDAEPVIKAGVQICYLAIQRDDAKKLSFCARRLLDFAKKNSFRQWEGVALRFAAIAEMLSGRHAEAEKHLLMSASVFEKLEEKGETYTVCLIAAEHFRGDCMLARGKITEALAFYENCVNIGNSVSLFRGLGLSLAKAAFCLMLLGRYDEAEKYLQKMGKFCGVMHTDWNEGLQGGGFAYSLMGLIKCRKNDWYHGAMCFAVAKRLVNEAKRPLWQAVLCWSKLELYRMAADMPEDFADEVLKHPKEWYEEQLAQLKSRVGWI